MVSFKQFMFEIMDSGNLSHSSKIDIFSMNHGLYVRHFCLQLLLANARLDIMHVQVYVIGAKQWCQFMKKQELTVNLRW